MPARDDFTADQIGESIINGNISVNLDWMGLDDEVALRTVDLFCSVVYAMADHDGISQNRDQAVAHQLRAMHTHVRNRLR